MQTSTSGPILATVTTTPNTTIRQTLGRTQKLKEDTNYSREGKHNTKCYGTDLIHNQNLRKHSPGQLIMEADGYKRRNKT